MEKGTYIIAFSGGADSRYLLDFFLEKVDQNILAKKNLVLAHYNHNLRGEESKRDQNFSRDIAKKFGLIFETKTRDFRQEEDENKLSENEARNFRYLFLEEVRQKYSADWIATGHHKDDQAETIFLQFLRGGGVNALSGMKEFSEERRIFRPLLGISKKDITRVLLSKNIHFCEDSTNAESKFTRNFLRNEVFPLLETRYPNFSQRIAEKSSYFEGLQCEFETSAHVFCAENDFFSTQGVSRTKFLNLFSAVQFEVIKKLIFPKFCDHKIFITIQNFLKNSDSGKKFEVKGVRFQVFGESIFCEKLH